MEVGERRGEGRERGEEQRREGKRGSIPACSCNRGRALVSLSLEGAAREKEGVSERGSCGVEGGSGSENETEGSRYS